MQLEIVAPSALLTLFFLVGCGSEPVATTAPATPLPVQTEVKNSDSHSEPLIMFETSGVWCNLCPSLRVSIFEDGPAILEAKYYEQVANKPGAFEERSTTHSQNLTPQQLARLSQMLDEMSFFDLADSYVPKTDSNGRFVTSPTCPQSLSDGPTYKISYRHGDRTKSVTHYDSCEPDDNVRKLPLFEKYVMELFSTDQIMRKRSEANVNSWPSNHQ